MSKKTSSRRNMSEPCFYKLQDEMLQILKKYSDEPVERITEKPSLSISEYFYNPNKLSQTNVPDGYLTLPNGMLLPEIGDTIISSFGTAIASASGPLNVIDEEEEAVSNVIKECPQSLLAEVQNKSVSTEMKRKRYSVEVEDISSDENEAINSAEKLYEYTQSDDESNEPVRKELRIENRVLCERKVPNSFGRPYKCKLYGHLKMRISRV